MHSTSPDFIFRQKRHVIVQIVFNKTGTALRRPVLGSIPRTGAPELASKQEILRPKLVMFTGRVIGATARHALCFIPFDCLNFKAWKTVVISVRMSDRAKGAAPFCLTEFVTLKDSGRLAEAVGNFMLTSGCKELGRVTIRVWTHFQTTERIQTRSLCSEWHPISALFNIPSYSLLCTSKAA